MSHVPIPPLLSSTPPPIDFDDETDNESSLPSVLIEDDEFEDFAYATATADDHNAPSLPATPLHQEISKSLENIDSNTQHKESSYSTDSINIKYISGNEIFKKDSDKKILKLGEEEIIFDHNSPPPLGTDNYTDIEHLQDFHLHATDQDGEDFDEDHSAQKYDDNTSLPSLKFDTLSINSKDGSTSVSTSEDIKTVEAIVYSNELSAFKCTEAHIIQEVNLSSNIDEHFSIEEKSAAEEFTLKREHLSELVLDESSLTNKKVINLTENSSPTINNETSNEFEFEANFDQFATFPEVSTVSSSQLLDKSIVHQNCNETLTFGFDDDENDDFDDFQDFTTAESVNSNVRFVSKTEMVDEYDDDFGGFSEVVTITQDSCFLSSITDSSKLVDKLKPILQIMFPSVNIESAQNQTEEESLSTSNTILKRIDSAKALDYQWPCSEVRHALIKSIGIDSRNILYGEKWNSSMPRYAANLSLSPLEPMKAHKDCTVVTKNNNNEKLLQPEVPAVEFDWNSSGLVNPLDASQAHPLLLDVDQLVVVANLDKINLDSYSCSSSTCLTTSTTMKTLPTPVPVQKLMETGMDKSAIRNSTQNYDSKTLMMTMNQLNQNLLSNDTFHRPSTPFFNSTTNSFHAHMANSIIASTYTACITYLTAANSYAFANTTAISAPNTSINLTSTIEKYDTFNNQTNLTSTENNLNAFANIFGFNNVNFNQFSDCRRVKETVCEETTKTIFPTESREFDAPHSLDCQSDSNYSTSDDFSNNQSQTFDLSALSQSTTTSATTTNTPTSTSPSTMSISSGKNHQDLTNTIFIKSTDTTEGDTIPSQTSLFLKSFDCDKVQESNISDITIESSENFNQSPCDAVATSTFAGPFKETHIFTPSKSDNSTRLTKNSENIKQTSIDFDYETAAAGIVIDEKVVKKEYRDVVYNPGFGVDFDRSKDECRKKDEDFVVLVKCQKVESCSSVKKESAVADPKNNEAIALAAVTNELYDLKQLHTALNSSVEIDDEFSDFQSVPAPAVSMTKFTKPDINASPIAQWTKITQVTSGANTPNLVVDEMILSPAILLPQAIQIDNQLKIDWPEPGINPEELARIEELFPPQTKIKSPKHNSYDAKLKSDSGQPFSISETFANHQNEDDEWSDYVSVPVSNNKPSTSQQCQKITQQPDNNSTVPNSFLKDEEWSDFVSSTPSNKKKSVHANSSINNPHTQFTNTIWQNANLYNNPLSYYHHQQHITKNNSTSSTANYNSMNMFSYQQNAPNVNSSSSSNNNFLNNKHQQIYITSDFLTATSSQPALNSTYAPPSQQRHHFCSSNIAENTKKQLNKSSSSNQFSSAKIAPSISLIPDLGFVAPFSDNTNFVSLLSKSPGFANNIKK